MTISAKNMKKRKEGKKENFCNRNNHDPWFSSIIVFHIHFAFLSGKSGQSPLILRSPLQEEDPEFSSSSLRPNFTADLQQHVGPKAPSMSMNPCTITEGQPEEDRGEFFSRLSAFYF
jgi:hypothetical protein